MNTSESESSRPEPSGLQVELGAKPRSHLKAIWLLPVLLAAVAGSVTLLAWLPTSSPTSSPARIVSLSPTVEFQGSSSTVPPLTWSPGSIEVILSPGESASRSITLTSSSDLTNVIIEAVPTIAPFLTIKPSTFSRIRANRAEKVQVSFAVPSTATLGTYPGTIHLRTGTQTLPQTLKVAINVWQSFADSSIRITFKYPPGFNAYTANSIVRIVDPAYPDLPAKAEISVFSIDVDPTLSVQQQLIAIATDVLGQDFSAVATFTSAGVLVYTTTAYGEDYFAYNAVTRRAIDIRGSSSFFLSPTFSGIVATLAF